MSKRSSFPRITNSVVILLASLLSGLGVATAADRTSEEFEAYAARRMAKVEAQDLAAFVKLVDANKDGVISDAEFASRIDAYQQVFKNVQPKHSRRGHGLPDNWLTDFKKAREASQKSGKPIVAMFSASWCGPCRAMIGTVYPTDEAQKALQEFVPVYIDAEKQRELATENDIHGFPTFVCFDSDGAVIDKHVGGGDVEKFTEMLAKFHVAEDESQID